MQEDSVLSEEMSINPFWIWLSSTKQLSAHKTNKWGRGTWPLRWRHIPGRPLWSRSQAYAHKADSFTQQGSHLEKRSHAVPRRRACLGGTMFSFHAGSSISGSLSVFVFVVWDQVESPDSSWTLWVAEDDAELLVLLPPHPKCWTVGMPCTEQSLG